MNLEFIRDIDIRINW